MKREMPMLPRINLPVVDVQDVAEAHVRAMKIKDAAGRFIYLEPMEDNSTISHVVPSSPHLIPRS